MYAKIVNNIVEAFPYDFSRLKEDHPNVSFPSNVSVIPEATINSYNVYSVTQQPDPSFDNLTQKLVQGVPVLNGSNWVVTRVATALTTAELKKVENNQDAVNLKGDSQVLALLRARPAQINSYIETNVANLAQAKDVLKILARALAVVAQNQLD